MRIEDVIRVALGTFTRPAEETGGAPRDEVVNHLHFDHCGGNPLLGATPVARAARRARDRAGRRLHVRAPPRRHDVRAARRGGRAAAGPARDPTPGHVDGRQSLVVAGDDGSVVLAGQSHDGATHWASDRAAPGRPAWMSGLLELDPKRVVFAHDDEEWCP